MTQEEHDKYQSEYRECCMLLGNANPKQMSAILEIVKAFRQPNVSGTFCRYGCELKEGIWYAKNGHRCGSFKMCQAQNCH